MYQGSIFHRRGTRRIFRSCQKKKKFCPQRRTSSTCPPAGTEGGSGRSAPRPPRCPARPGSGSPHGEGARAALPGDGARGTSMEARGSLTAPASLLAARPSEAPGMEGAEPPTRLGPTGCPPCAQWGHGPGSASTPKGRTRRAPPGTCGSPASPEDVLSAGAGTRGNGCSPPSRPGSSPNYNEHSVSRGTPPSFHSRLSLRHSGLGDTPRG